MRIIIVIVTLWIGLGFALYADDQLSAETQQFMSLNFADRVRETASVTSEETLRRVNELKEAAIRNPAGKEWYLEGRAFLGDEEALKQLAAEFIGNDGASSGLLAPMRNPHIIDLVAPEFFRNEPMQLTGGDVVFIPRSFRAAELAVEILADSLAFNGGVINWARTVKGLSWSEKRELIRPWWKANEQFFREKNYKAVQPGPEPPHDPFATERPEVAIPAATVAAPISTPTPVASAPVAAANQSSTPSSGLLWTIASAAVVLLAGLLFYWKRST